MYEAIGSAIGAFSNAAASGQVSIEAAAAEDALAKIGKVKDQLTALLAEAGAAESEVRLGANPVGLAMSRKSVSRYDGDDSFLAALRLLQDQTDRAERALRLSIDNYVDIDTGHAQHYGRQS
ncbi:hypothetical protein [Actinophytocola xanthii]|uniref:Uncharacterized protein n=1 Tax=Actinophytocola xanthii TaxID=1912961 RepID=A0A1Q8C0Q2_9PSEU|nr:hypothetical protein [Actinophytocola xanthii]OLF07934.1 hypothetical protein BU204_35000 [Actinophytocola xanthii]